MRDFSPLRSFGPLRRVEQPVAPPLGDYLDHYRLTPLPSARESSSQSSSSQKSVTLHAGFLSTTGLTTKPFELWTQVWAPATPRGTIFLVHGYLDHLGLYNHLLHQLLALGWQVVMWDLPGHGLSSGPRATIDDFDDYVASFNAVESQVAERGLAPGPWIAIGQSTGAAIVATDTLVRGASAPWQALALLAPLVRPWGWRQSRWLHSLAGSFISTIPRSYRANTSDAEFADFLRHEDPLQDAQVVVPWVSAMRRWMPTLLKSAPQQLPVLILQGEKDVTVDWRWNLAVLEEKFPHARVVHHPLARHHLVNEAEDIRQTLFRDLADFLQSLPAHDAATRADS